MGQGSAFAAELVDQLSQQNDMVLFILGNATQQRGGTGMTDPLGGVKIGGDSVMFVVQILEQQLAEAVFVADHPTVPPPAAAGLTETGISTAAIPPSVSVTSSGQQSKR